MYSYQERKRDSLRKETLRNVDKSSSSARRRLMFTRYGGLEGRDEIGFARRRRRRRRRRQTGFPSTNKTDASIKLRQERIADIFSMFKHVAWKQVQWIFLIPIVSGSTCNLRCMKNIKSKIDITKREI